MNNYKILLLAVVFCGIQGLTVEAADMPFDMGQYSVITRVKPAKVRTVSTVEYTEFENLRTTKVLGVFCQQVDDFGGYSRQRHFFYSTDKMRLVEIPYLYDIDSLTDLGSYKNEYDMFAVKSNRFVHRGKLYVIPKFEYLSK